MGQLQKATLVEIKPDASGTEEPKTKIPVQFNPNTLKLTISSNLAGGTPAGSQVRQSTGSATTTLALDLVFDTADEGTSDKPRSVREKTAMVERFVVPKGSSESEQKPPKLRFQWGSFFIDGVMDSITIDFDHFASDGTPLRAKVGLSIKEQNSKYMFLQAGQGANQQGNAPSPLSSSPGAPGSEGGTPNQSAPALGGESLPDFAARMGLDPSAWRGLSTGIGGGLGIGLSAGLSAGFSAGLSAGLSGDLSLDAGVEVGFSANLSASAGIGVTLGVEAGVSASLEASFGLEASASISAVAGVGASADLAAGFALSAAGGVSAALATVQIAKTQAAEQQARAAFQAPPSAVPPSPVARAALPAPAAAANVSTSTTAPPAASGAATAAGTAVPTRPAPPDQPRAPLSATGLPTPAQQLEAKPAPPPPRVDPRSASFGFGVPLRSTVGQAAAERTGSLEGRVSLRAQVGSGFPPSTEDPVTPPWVALPLRDRARVSADRTQLRQRPQRRCGCGGPCRHSTRGC